MSSAETMLYGQATILQTIFTSLACKAQGYLEQFQVNLSLALKAQAQCRSTLEALALMKNPRPIQFVKRANISNGPQQVNNGAVVSRTETFASEPNKLWEAQHGNYPYTRAQGTASRVNLAVEAVGQVHRAEVAREQRAGEAQYLDGRAPDATAGAVQAGKCGGSGIA